MEQHDYSNTNLQTDEYMQHQSTSVAVEWPADDNNGPTVDIVASVTTSEPEEPATLASDSAATLTMAEGVLLPAKPMSLHLVILLESKNLLTHIWRHKLLYLGLIINTLFYVSATDTHWFHYFFSGSALHMCCRGLDFYQVPNGLWSYIHGGSLTGWLPPGVGRYSEGFPSNYNVYHPLFTILVGSFLVLFKSKDSFYVWMYLKLVCTSAVIIYFYHSFKRSKYLEFALFTMLINSTQYIEITISQYQSVLNFFTFLLLIALATGRKKLPSALYYLVGLITKPIGLLWLPVLLFKKQFTIALVGGSLFVLITLLFTWTHIGTYYSDNLIWHLQATDIGSPIQIITLAALLKAATPLTEQGISLIKDACLLLIVFFCSLKRVSLFKGIFLSTVYFYLFYDWVYEYHYTTLIPILAICLVMCPEFQTRLARALVLLISLPNAFFILHFFQIGYSHSNPSIPDPDVLGWQIIVLSRIVPLILLSCVVLRSDVKPTFIGMKRFLIKMLKVNRKLALFG